jgi:hypothetical protein
MAGNVKGKKAKPQSHKDPKPAPRSAEEPKPAPQAHEDPKPASRPPEHPIPALAEIVPPKGAAGALVSITAKKDLTETTGVWFGDKKAEITARAPPTSLQVKAPESGRDKVKILVSTRRGDFELGEFAYEKAKK